jgi:hypothetical protein
MISLRLAFGPNESPSQGSPVHSYGFYPQRTILQSREESSKFSCEFPTLWKSTLPFISSRDWVFCLKEDCSQIKFRTVAKANPN